MNANDARLSQLFVAANNSRVQDDSPNESGGVAGNNYDLLLRGEAGGVLGDSGASYTLSITAYDVTAGAAEPDLDPFASPQNENFNNAAPGNWQASGADFVKDEKYDITVGAGVTRGHVFRYTAALIATNNEVVSIIESDPFVLVP
jgi:hypothetical protein